MTTTCTSSSSSKFFPARCSFRWRNKCKSLGYHKQQQFYCEFPLDVHILLWEIVWQNAPRIWRDFGSALPFQTCLTQITQVLPLSNEHGSQVKDQGRQQCCHNKHKKFPYWSTRDVSLIVGHASYVLPNWLTSDHYYCSNSTETKDRPWTRHSSNSIHVQSSLIFSYAFIFNSLIHLQVEFLLRGSTIKIFYEFERIRIPMWAWMFVSCICCELCSLRCLRRADASSRGILPSGCVPACGHIHY
jgi:hypothetical protein